MPRIDYIGDDGLDAFIEVGRLEGGVFDGLSLHRAWLNCRVLRNATFRGANLRGAFFYESDMENVDFTGSNLITTHFEGTRLTNAILRDCRLIGAMMFNADLRGADLTGSSGEPSLKGAVYDSRTRWPEGLDFERLGAVRVPD